MKRKITIVTGNMDKLKEWERLLPDTYNLEPAVLELEEIQSLDLERIVLDKAQRAYQKLGTPLVVEDVAAGLAKLNGLPGPFIKFFEASLGRDALFQLAGKPGEAVLISIVIAYYDATKSITVRGEVSGTVVEPRGTNGFGFDCCVVPDGQTKTFAEMSETEKDQLSHRSKAVRELVKQLKDA